MGKGKYPMVTEENMMVTEQEVNRRKGTRPGLTLSIFSLLLFTGLVVIPLCVAGGLTTPSGIPAPGFRRCLGSAPPEYFLLIGGLFLFLTGSFIMCKDRIVSRIRVHGDRVVVYRAFGVRTTFLVSDTVRYLLRHDFRQSRLTGYVPVKTGFLVVTLSDGTDIHMTTKSETANILVRYLRDHGGFRALPFPSGTGNE